MSSILGISRFARNDICRQTMLTGVISTEPRSGDREIPDVIQ
jgi:hypothetical protein